jgi:hypothetical protein
LDLTIQTEQAGDLKINLVFSPSISVGTAFAKKIISVPQNSMIEFLKIDFFHKRGRNEFSI